MADDASDEEDLGPLQAWLRQFKTEHRGECADVSEAALHLQQCLDEQDAADWAEAHAAVDRADQEDEQREINQAVLSVLELQQRETNLLPSWSRS